MVGPTTAPTTAATGPPRPPQPPQRRGGRGGACRHMATPGRDPSAEHQETDCAAHDDCASRCAHSPRTPTAQNPPHIAQPPAHAPWEHCAAATVHTRQRTRKAPWPARPWGRPRLVSGQSRFRGGWSEVACLLGVRGRTLGHPDHGPDHGWSVRLAPFTRTGNRSSAPVLLNKHRHSGSPVLGPTMTDRCACCRIVTGGRGLWSSVWSGVAGGLTVMDLVCVSSSGGLGITVGARPQLLCGCVCPVGGASS